MLKKAPTPTRPNIPTTELETALVVPEKRQKGFIKGQSGNPHGRPLGAKNKWSIECVNILGLRSKKIINKVIQIALEDGHKDQGLMLKLCIERIIPQQKAIEVTGKDGQELSVKIVVDSVEQFSEKRVINGFTGELDD